MDREEILREADRLQDFANKLVLDGCGEEITELLNASIFKIRQFALGKKG